MRKRRKSQLDDLLPSSTDTSPVTPFTPYIDREAPPQFISPWTNEPIEPDAEKERGRIFVAALANAPLARDSATTLMPPPLSARFREPHEDKLRTYRARSIPDLRTPAQIPPPVPQGLHLRRPSHEPATNRGRPREKRVLRYEPAPDAYSAYLAPNPALLPRWSWEAEDIQSWASRDQAPDARSHWSPSSSVRQRQARTRRSRPSDQTADHRAPSQPVGRQPVSIELPSSFNFLRRRRRADSLPAPVSTHDASTQTDDALLIASYRPHIRRRSSSLSNLRRYERRTRNGEVYRIPNRSAPAPPHRRPAPQVGPSALRRSAEEPRTQHAVAFKLPKQPPTAPIPPAPSPAVEPEPPVLAAPQQTPAQVDVLRDYFAAPILDSKPLPVRFVNSRSLTSQDVPSEQQPASPTSFEQSRPGSPISFPRVSLEHGDSSTALTTAAATIADSPGVRSAKTSIVNPVPTIEVPVTHDAPIVRPSLTPADTADSFATARPSLSANDSFATAQSALSTASTVREDDETVRLPDVQLRTSAHVDAFSLPGSLEVDPDPSYIDVRVQARSRLTVAVRLVAYTDHQASRPAADGRGQCTLVVPRHRLVAHPSTFRKQRRVFAAASIRQSSARSQSRATAQQSRGARSSLNRAVQQFGQPVR